MAAPLKAAQQLRTARPLSIPSRSSTLSRRPRPAVTHLHAPGYALGRLGRPLRPAHRAAVLRVLCELGQLQPRDARKPGAWIVGLRQRALITLALDSGLRLSELCALELGQVVEDLAADRIRIRSASFLVSSQAKGGEAGAGPFSLPRRARRALGPYLRAVRDHRWISWHASSPLFLGHRGRAGQPGHARLSPRAAQRDWQLVQRRAQLPQHYSFHTLRHDFVNRLRLAGADAFDLCQAARWRRLETAVTYVATHDAERRVLELAELASR